jgi:DNA-binding beta-propeller fold protein YncE
MRRLLARRWVLSLTAVALLLGTAGVGVAVYKKMMRKHRPRDASVSDASEAPREGTTFAPRPVALDPHLTVQTVATAGGKALHLTYPVCIVHREGAEYYVCNYRQLLLLDLDKQRSWEIAAPPGLASDWVPTALFYHAASRLLYVATYTGGKIVVLDAADKTRPKLAAVIAHPEMKGPEGVAVTEDGRFVAVADYDGHAIFLFDAAGRMQWKYTAHTCHGVSILRRPDGQQFVFGAALGDTAVFKLSFKGQLLKRVKTPTWYHGHGYLYPTTLVTRKDGLTAVTDAYRGQISFLDEDLSPFAVLGANGPGTGFFNNPYGSCWNAAGDHVFVADTFRDRIVDVRLKDQTITAIYRLADLTAEKSFVPPRLVRESELEALAHPLEPPDLNLATAEPFGRTLTVRHEPNYVIHRDPHTRVKLPLPRFNAAVNKRLGTEWNPGVQGLVPVACPEVTAWCLGMAGLFTDYPLRFLFARNYEHEGGTYLLLFSPQSRDVLVSGRGVTVPLPLRKDTWLVEDTLVGPGYVIAADRLVEAGARRIDAFLSQGKGQMPLEAIRTSLFPNLGVAQFRDQFQASMRSPEGATFARECWEAADAAGQRAAAERYLATCEGQHMLQMAEILLAEMVLCERR